METRTFEDGARYVLAPGARPVYGLQVAASSLEVLGVVAAEPVALVVPADGDEELTAPVLAVRKRVLAGGGQMRRARSAGLLALAAAVVAGCGDRRVAEGDEPIAALQVAHVSERYSTEYWQAQAAQQSAV